MRLFIVVLFATTMAFIGCQNQDVVVTSQVVMLDGATIPEKPDDPAWEKASECRATMLLQDIVEPRLMSPSTPEVRVRAIRGGEKVSFRLEWVDSTFDDLVTPSSFSDACAIQTPSDDLVDLPAPQMGEPGRTVEITYWNASWQASVNGRSDSITALYPNAAIDHYPFEARSLERGSETQQQMAARYSPARALGNRMAGPRATPVQDLVAQGAGSLASAPATTSTGLGQRTAQGWAVVITRQMTKREDPRFKSHIAFAVWDGTGEEVGARKMRTDWIPLITGSTP